MLGEQHEAGQLGKEKQSLEQMSVRFERCRINDGKMKDQASSKSDRDCSERVNNKIYRVLRSWSLQENVLFLGYLVENRQGFEEELLRQRHKIFYQMSKRIKLRVVSVCCKRFYQLYAICGSDLDTLICRISEFIEKQKRRKQKEDISNQSLKVLMEIHNAQTDSEYHKIISHYKGAIVNHRQMQEIDYK